MDLTKAPLFNSIMSMGTGGRAFVPIYSLLVGKYLLFFVIDGYFYRMFLIIVRSNSNANRE